MQQCRSYLRMVPIRRHARINHKRQGMDVRFSLQAKDSDGDTALQAVLSLATQDEEPPDQEAAQARPGRYARLASSIGELHPARGALCSRAGADPLSEAGRGCCCLLCVLPELAGLTGGIHLTFRTHEPQT